MLTTGWNPLAGASPDIVEEVKQILGPEHDAHDPQSALEVSGWSIKFQQRFISRLAGSDYNVQSIPLLPGCPKRSE